MHQFALIVAFVPEGSRHQKPTQGAGELIVLETTGDADEGVHFETLPQKEVNLLQIDRKLKLL